MWMRPMCPGRICPRHLHRLATASNVLTGPSELSSGAGWAPARTTPSAPPRAVATLCSLRRDENRASPSCQLAYSISRNVRSTCYGSAVKCRHSIRTKCLPVLRSYKKTNLFATTVQSVKESGIGGCMRHCHCAYVVGHPALCVASHAAPAGRGPRCGEGSSCDEADPCHPRCSVPTCASACEY